MSLRMLQSEATYLHTNLTTDAQLCVACEVARQFFLIAKIQPCQTPPLFCLLGITVQEFEKGKKPAGYRKMALRKSLKEDDGLQQPEKSMTTYATRY